MSETSIVSHKVTLDGDLFAIMDTFPLEMELKF